MGVKTQYWLVTWIGKTRMSTRVATAKQACHNTFGFAKFGMIAKPIGARLPSNERRTTLSDDDSGWYWPELDPGEIRPLAYTPGPI